MHAVVDQLHHHPVVGERRHHRPGVPVVDRAHLVEQVRGHGGSGVEGGAGPVVVGVGVAHGRDHAFGHGRADQVERAREFGRERDHRDVSPAGREDPPELGRVRAAQERRVVRPAPAGSQVRALQVDSGQITGFAQFGQCRHLAQRLLGGGGHQAAHQGRHAVPPVGLDDGQRPFGVAVTEGRSGAAVDVDVDVAGGEQAAAQVDGLRRAVRRGTRTDLGDPPVLDAQPAVENPVSGHHLRVCQCAHQTGNLLCPSSPDNPDKTVDHALTRSPCPLIMVYMSAGELLVQRLHVDLRQQASALCRS
ncbi:hypothetical protein ABH917_004830 [Thermobifida halotolerans]